MTAQIERALQQEVMLRLRAWPVIALPIPNSIWIPTRTAQERTLAARIVSQMKNAGQLVPGAPDLAIFWPGGGGMVELKRPKTKGLLGTTPEGRPSDTQIAMAERAASLGINHAYCTSWPDVKERLETWGATQ